MVENRVALAVVVVLAAALVAAVPLTSSVAFPSQANERAAAVTPVDACTTITEPGRYELAGDLEGADGTCLHVQSSDVVLDGNGHTIAGSGSADSVGLLVYGATRGASVDNEDALDNVTVANVAVAGWERGVQVGDIRGVGTTASLRDVTVRDNANAGVYLVEAENLAVDGLDASNNANGVLLWEVQDSTLTGVTATDNDDRGVGLLQDVYDVTLRDLTATGNGDGGYSSGGVYASTDARRNHVVDAYLADNDGAGIRFSDSGDNVLEDAVVEANDGPGIHGVPAGDELLRNVSVAGSGGPELHLEEGELSADGLFVGGDASVSFDSEPLSLERADVDEVTPPPAGEPAVERGLRVADLDSSAAVTFHDVGNEPTALWVFDGAEWRRVDDSAHDAADGTVSGTVSVDGVVVPVRAGSGGDDQGERETMMGPPDGTETTPGTPGATDDTGPSTPETSTTTANPGTATDGAPPGDAASTLVVSSTRADHDFGYIFVVEGDVERVSADGGAADGADRVIDNGDGTVTVVGSTGDQSGDAFRVSGTVTTFYTPAAPTDYALELDGVDVTDRVPGPNE